MEKVKKRKERTITKEQIQGVIGTLATATLDLYLQHWRFSSFVRRKKYQNHYRYEYVYCKDFFNNLYTYLLIKQKTYAARNLKDTFAQVGMNLEVVN